MKISTLSHTPIDDNKAAERTYQYFFNLKKKKKKSNQKRKIDEQQTLYVAVSGP